MTTRVAESLEHGNAGTSSSPPKPSLLQMFFAYLRVGAFAFGGGLASLPLFREELCRKRNWLPEDELASWFGVSQAVPGVILVNVSATTGLRLRGLAGAVAAVAGALSAPVLCLAVLGRLWIRWSDSSWLAAAMRGVRPAVLALLLAAGARLAWRSVRGWVAAVLMLGAMAWLLAGGSPVWVLLAVLFGGPLVAVLRARRGGGDEKGLPP